LRAFVWVPTSHNVPSLQLLFVVHLLEHSCSSQDMGKLALLNTVRINQVSYLVGGLLRLACSPTSEHANMFMDVIDFIGDSIDSVNTTSRCSWMRKKVLESAQQMTPPWYLTAMTVVPIFSLG
jgi:hypothetical protein